MASWKPVGVVAEGRPLWISGVNVWDHVWNKTDEASVQLPHPSYPSQTHDMSIYEIAVADRRIRFATGELSANVWGFYEPQ